MPGWPAVVAGAGLQYAVEDFAGEQHWWQGQVKVQLQDELWVKVKKRVMTT